MGPTSGDDQAAQDDAPQPMVSLSSSSLLSLVARYENQIVAAIICDLDGKCGYVHQKDLSDQELQDQIIRALVDKAARKLNSRGVTRCRINLPHNTKEHPLWEAAKWSDFFEAIDKPMRSTASVDQMATQYNAIAAPDPHADGDADQKPEFEDESISGADSEPSLAVDPSGQADSDSATPATVEEGPVAADSSSNSGF